MIKAKISQVKAELSKYIRLSLKGEEIIITDRDRSVAKLVAFSTGDRLVIRAPQLDLKAVLEPAAQRKFDQKLDVLDLLVADREDRF